MNVGKVYIWQPDPAHPSGGRVVLATRELARLEPGGRDGVYLTGPHVEVRNGGILNMPAASGAGYVPTPIGHARPDQSGDFLFEPVRGGGRMDKLPLTRPHYRERYIQASRFGEVNAYFHLDRIAAYVDELLRDLGADPLPRVIAVVNAHHAAVERPDGTRDGILRYERWVPFQGGHYRLPSRVYTVAEHLPVAPEGEIHLGPGWKLLEHGALVDVAGARYRHNAAHNAGTIYHEFGHHISRHTADFRANCLRPPGRQSNLKTELDEGFCDYWTATMLDTPHIWAWHRRHDEEEIHDRSLTCSVSMADYDPSEDADPHANGTIWAAALWELRSRMKGSGSDGVRECDKLVLQTLLALGRQVGNRNPVTIKRARRARAKFSVALALLLRADDQLHAGQHRQAILDSFCMRGIHPEGVAGAGPDHQAADARVPLPATPTPRASQRSRLHSGWAANPRALAELEEARARLIKHVPAGDIPETQDLFARGELGEELRRRDEPPISVLISGDTMLGSRSRSVIAERGLEYPFKALRPILRRAAIVVGNLEGPIAIEAKKLADNPRNFAYRVDPRMSIALKRAGFHVMTLANNHLLDCGRRGVLETLAVLAQAGIATIGAGVNEESAHAPVILEAHGLRIGMLGYYWNRRTAARASVPGSAMDPPDALARDIQALSARVDRVLVTFHWGVPYVREPSAEDRAKARLAIDLGADAVVGHHAHVIQPFEIHRGRPIFYGIGNCAFGSGNSKGEGLLVGLRFEPERTRIQVYPIYVKNRDPRVDYQPKVLRGAGARNVLLRLVEQSGADGERLAIEDFRASLDLPWEPRPSSRDTERRTRA